MLCDHCRCGKLSCVVVRSNAGAEHRVPTPEPLFPERLGPSEFTIFYHAIVAAPDVVHKNIDRLRLADDRVERSFYLGIDSVIAANTRYPPIHMFLLRD